MEFSRLRLVEPLVAGADPGSVARAEPGDLVAAVTRLAEENAQLRQAMVSRAGIEQAKGALMARFGIGPEAAFGVIRRLSQDSNVKVRELAVSIVAVLGEDTAHVVPCHPLVRELLSGPGGSTPSPRPT